MGDGLAGTTHIWNQFKQFVGMSHHKRGGLKPISYEEFLTTWPCMIFGLDEALGNAIVLDNLIGFGTNDFELIISIKNNKQGDTHAKKNPLNQGTVK